MRERALAALAVRRCVVSKIVIVAITVWGTALLAAGALAYVLVPAEPQDEQAEYSVASVQGAYVPWLRPTAEAVRYQAANVIAVPTTVIMVPREHRPVLPPPMPHELEPSKRTCSEWRELEQGNQGQLVRSCQ